MAEINQNIGPRPELEWVDKTLIDVDRNYQRELDGRSVEKILERFRWDHFGAVVLVRKGDRFVVTDGQHRVKAAQMHHQVTHVPALVTNLDGTSAEAENFLAINRGRKAVTPIEIYWAGLASGDEMASRIKDAVEKAGCSIAGAQGEYRPGMTNAVGALGRCLNRYGDAATIKAMRIMRLAWPKDPKALRGTFVVALARICRANSSIDEGRMIRMLSTRSVGEMTAAAEGFRKLSGGSAETALSKAVTEIYNKGLSTNTIMIGQAA